LRYLRVGLFPLSPDEFDGRPTVQDVRDYCTYVTHKQIAKVDAPLAEELRRVTRRRRLNVLGVFREGRNIVKQRWERLQPGDLMCFITKGRVIARAPILHKAMSWKLGEHLWPPTTYGRRYHHLFFLGGMRGVGVDTLDVVDHHPRAFEVGVAKALL
jgi:hypothetical protein